MVMTANAVLRYPLKASSTYFVEFNYLASEIFLWQF